MASKGGLLTDLQLKQWMKAGKPVSAPDGGGLMFKLSAAANATWVLRYRHGNQRPEMTLGPYPAIGLSEARTMTLLKRAEIAQGRSPMAERRKARAALVKDWTVRQLIADYREKVLITLAKSTRTCYSRHLKRIENRFGPMGVREIESSDIVALIEDCQLTWGESSLLHVTAKCLFTHACGKRLINMAIRILLATGVRGSELFTAKWRDVHLDETRRHIPASKTGPAMDVPTRSGGTLC